MSSAAIVAAIFAASVAAALIGFTVANVYIIRQDVQAIRRELERQRREGR